MELDNRICFPRTGPLYQRLKLHQLLLNHLKTKPRLIFLQAPAGYGKTSLLANFTQSFDWPTCWCTLDVIDRYPHNFLQLLARSLADRFWEIDPHQVKKRISQSSMAQGVQYLARLSDDLGPFLFVLDDFHKAMSINTWLTLLSLLKWFPENCVFTVASQEKIASDIQTELRTYPMAYISVDELRFTTDEIQWVMRKQFGRYLDPVATNQLRRQTDGNIAEILLNGQAQHVNPTRKQRAETWHSQREFVDSYLLQGTIAKQPPDFQNYLRSTPQLSITHLSQLDEAYLPSNIASDDTDSFTEFLQELSVQKALYHQVSLEMAELLIKYAQFEGAVHLYFLIESWAEAVTMFEEHGQFLCDTGRALTLHSWLRQLPGPILEKRPRLQLLQGRIYSEYLDDQEMAASFYQQAETIFLQQADWFGLAAGQIVMANRLRLLEQPEAALAKINEAVTSLLEPGHADEVLIAWAKQIRGLIYCDINDHFLAMNDIRAALTVFERFEDSSQIALCHHSIGRTLAAQGNCGGAEYHYQNALRSWEALGNEHALCYILSDLGYLYFILGQIDKARHHLKNSLIIAKQLGIKRVAAKALIGLGDLDLLQARYTPALDAYTLALNYAQEINVTSLVLHSQIKIGQCYYEQGQVDDVLAQICSAKGIAAELGLRTEYGLAAFVQGKVYAFWGQYDESATLFEEAFSNFAKYDVMKQIQVRMWRGAALLADFKTFAALDQLKKVMQLLSEMGDLRKGVAPTCKENYQLLKFFLHWHRTPLDMRNKMFSLLKETQTLDPQAELGLQFFAFGIPTVIRCKKDRQIPQRSESPGGLEVLTFILLKSEEGGCTRDEICAEIWPELAPKEVNAHFYQAIRWLRQSFFNHIDGVIVQDGYYTVSPEYCEWSDIVIFEKLYARLSGLGPKEALPLHIELIKLYQGEFLSGFALRDWSLYYRRRCEAIFLRVVHRAGDCLFDSGSPWAALHIFENGIAQSYYEETLHQGILKVYGQLGLYKDMQDHYEKMCGIFQKELAHLPQPETQELYKILQQRRHRKRVSP